MAHWFENLTRASVAVGDAELSRRQALSGLVAGSGAAALLMGRPRRAFGQAANRNSCSIREENCLADAVQKRSEREVECYDFLENCTGDAHANTGICYAAFAACDSQSYVTLEEDRAKCLEESKTCCTEDRNCSTCKVCRDFRCVERECPDCERCENDKCVSELRSNEKCCFGSPRDVMSDPRNCGECGRICPAGRPCRNGVCTCPSGSASCVDIAGRAHCCPPFP